MCSLISATSVALIVAVVGAGSGGLFVSYWKRCGSSVLICSVVANSGGPCKIFKACVWSLSRRCRMMFLMSS